MNNRFSSKDLSFIFGYFVVRLPRKKKKIVKKGFLLTCNANNQLSLMLIKYPKAAMMIGDIMNGTHPGVAYSRYYDHIDLELNENDINYPAFLEAEKERLNSAK